MPAIKGFQWNARKNASNFAKHGIDFDEALEVFYGPHALRRSDRNNEERWIAIGETDKRIVTVAFTYRGEEVRIISARRARRNEERTYRNEALGRTTQGQD